MSKDPGIEEPRNQNPLFSLLVEGMGEDKVIDMMSRVDSSSLPLNVAFSEDGLSKEKERRAAMIVNSTVEELSKRTDDASCVALQLMKLAIAKCGADEIQNAVTGVEVKKTKKNKPKKKKAKTESTETYAAKVTKVKEGQKAKVVVQDAMEVEEPPKPAKSEPASVVGGPEWASFVVRDSLDDQLDPVLALCDSVGRPNFGDVRRVRSVMRLHGASCQVCSLVASNFKTTVEVDKIHFSGKMNFLLMQVHLWIAYSDDSFDEFQKTLSSDFPSLSQGIRRSEMEQLLPEIREKYSI